MNSAYPEKYRAHTEKEREQREHCSLFMLLCDCAFLVITWSLVIPGFETGATNDDWSLVIFALFPS